MGHILKVTRSNYLCWCFVHLSEDYLSSQGEGIMLSHLDPISSLLFLAHPNALTPYIYAYISQLVHMLALCLELMEMPLRASLSYTRQLDQVSRG